MKTTKTYAVAQHNETKKFFYFVLGAGACSQGHVDSPSLAAEGQYVPYREEALLKPLREPAYYFENSARMRGWLENHTMVWITETTESAIVDNISEND